MDHYSPPPDDFHDEQWQADYQIALEDLGVVPRKERLPAVISREVPPKQAQRPCLVPFSIPRDQEFLGEIRRADFDTDSSFRHAILQRTDIKKTADARVREVFYLGERIGKVARSPYQGMIWLSEANRKYPFSSAADAALDLLTSKVPELGGRP